MHFSSTKSKCGGCVGNQKQLKAAIMVKSVCLKFVVAVAFQRENCSKDFGTMMEND